tara:strand:- start:824 stop:1435 length:612 start_codon:yes stop_codon:yes gene_type:complete
MNKLLALDIETANYSHEIGGWDKTAMFEPTVVTTWDGEVGTIYCNKSLDPAALPKGTILKELHPKTLGDDLIKHIEEGGRVIGHNIVNFDLPVLRDALDCWTAGDLLGKMESLVDTSLLCRKAGADYHDLNTLSRHTLEDTKTAAGVDAPIMWKQGRYNEVAAYCLKDSQLVHRLWTHGHTEGIIKSRSRETGEIVEIEVDWI